KQHLGEALHLRQTLKSSPTVAFTDEKLGWVAAADGQPAAAVRLLGAAAAMRERAGADLYPYETSGHERAQATARAALDEATFAAAWSEGQTMTPDQVIAFALNVSHSAGPARLGPRTDGAHPLTARECEIS